jgi:hypothetical protein
LTEGKTGELPDWYRTRTAAKQMGVPPWELANVPLIWQEWELTATAAEQSAQKEQDRHAARKNKRKK